MDLNVLVHAQSVPTKPIHNVSEAAQSTPSILACSAMLTALLINEPMKPALTIVPLALYLATEYVNDLHPYHLYNYSYE